MLDAFSNSYSPTTMIPRFKQFENRRLGMEAIHPFRQFAALLALLVIALISPVLLVAQDEPESNPRLDITQSVKPANGLSLNQYPQGDRILDQTRFRQNQDPTPDLDPYRNPAYDSGEPANPIGRYTPQQYIVGPSAGISRELKIDNDNGLVTLVARNASLTDVLNLISDKYKLSFVFGNHIDQLVSISLRDKSLEDTLTAVLAVGGYTWTQQRGIIHVAPLNRGAGALLVAPEISGREVRVFALDFVSAKEIDPVVKGMLSPVGLSYMFETNPTDNRQTRESIVVEDLPGALARIEQYVCQIDTPPRQVMIDVHVLEIELDEDERHGINFENIAKIGRHELRLGTLGVDASGTSAFFAELEAGNLKGFLNAVQTLSDSKTLASTKILALNGQKARMQVGQQLGFRVVTTTQTSTLEEVKFLDVGVVLNVTPRISRDGRIMMQVKPEVSSGQINPETGLPEEETSEVETNVMLSDGQGMIIGGLIQEKDNKNVSQVPLLGDIRGVGRLFRREESEIGRSEIIFALLPRIVDVDSHQNQVYADRKIYDEQERAAALKATQSIVDPHLNRNFRQMDRYANQIQRQRTYHYNNQTIPPAQTEISPQPLDNFQELYPSDGEYPSAPGALGRSTKPAGNPQVLERNDPRQFVNALRSNPANQSVLSDVRTAGARDLDPATQGRAAQPTLAQPTLAQAQYYQPVQPRRSNSQDSTIQQATFEQRIQESVTRQTRTPWGSNPHWSRRNAPEGQPEGGSHVPSNDSRQRHRQP